MKSWRAIVALLAVVALWTPAAVAQTATGSISGVVEDESKGAIPGASVVVTNVDTGIARTVTTDQGGRYHVPGLISGHYEVQAQLQGFQTAIRKGIQMTIGAEPVVDLVLQVGIVTETTIVTAQAPLVDVVSSTVSGLVDDKTIRDLPLNGRSFDQLITLQSAAPMINDRGRTSLTGQGNVFSVSGARTQSNQYLMDGTELVGAGSITTQPGGVLGKNMGVEAIQEFTVLTSNYSAAYGKRAGGVVNIATRSGTNQFHGSLFEFHRDDRLDARNFFDQDAPPPFERNQFGGALGGPIRKDQTFFFATYEALRETLGETFIAIVPDANARRGLLPDPANPGQFRNVGLNPSVAPYMAALFPAPNGRNFGDGTAESINSVTRTSRQDFGLVRVDHRLSDKDSLFGRYNISQAKLADPDTNSLFGSLDNNRDQLFTLEEKRAYSTFLNSARFGFTRARVFSDSLPLVDIDSSLHFLDGAKTIGPLSFSTNSVGGPLTTTGTGSSAERFFVVNQLDWQDQINYYRGAHSIQAGVQFQRIEHDENFQNSVRGSYEFTSLETFLRGVASRFRAPAPGGAGDAHKDYLMKYFSTYFQDDLKARHNLTVNLGLRYELMTAPVEQSGNRVSNYVADIVNGTRVLQTEPRLGSPFFKAHNHSVAPRVGFAWDATGNGSTAVRGGVGVFYDQIENEFRFFTANNAPYFGLTEVNNPPFPLGFASGTGAQRTPTPDSIDPNIEVPRRTQWNIGVQRQLTTNMALGANYVNSRGYNLMRVTDANTARPQILADGTKFYPAGAARKNPALGGNRYVSSDASSWYDGLQLEVNQRVTSGLRYKVSFTYAKSTDNASVVIAQHSLAGPATTMDPDDIDRDKGPSAFDVRRNFVANFTYDVPTGGLTGISKAVFGGWQLGGIVTLQDGTPFTALVGFSRSRDLARSLADRPNLAPGASANPVLGGPDRYFDPTVFVLPAIGTYGSLGRDTLVGPGIELFDMNLVRVVQLSGHNRCDIRLEVFNVFNHANFGIPDSTIFNSDGSIRGAAGRITTTSTTSRQVQLGVKYSF
jgi:hypothetical protein